MERNNSKEWINSLKIAIINNDLKKIKEYSKRTIPENFNSLEEAKEALNLVNQAKKILEEKKDTIQKKMFQLKQQNKYNNSYISYTREWNI
ncbi:MAG: hypothetical protein DSY40_02745 [Nautilia sp.]|nr:MAG: hypothetical protein DSY40_02745 [Nautilia sp.]